MNGLNTGYLEEPNKYKRREGEGTATDHLAGSHTNSLGGKLSPAHVKEILQTWAEQIDDQDVVETLLAEMVYLWDASWIWRR